MGLLLGGVLLGLVMETASLRLGGTHCHVSGVVNLSECSSANSIVYYGPWVYACVLCAQRLCDPKHWAFSLVCGGLFFGMCGVYEMQGPLAGWWLWPQKDGLVKAGWQGWQFGHPNTDNRGLVAQAHVVKALTERFCGFPIFAPFFHFAFGWAVSFLLQITGFTSFFGVIFCCLVGPALHLVWFQPVNLVVHLFDVPNMIAAPSIMGACILVAFALRKVPTTSYGNDYLLFTIPTLSHVYFLHHALIGGGSWAPIELRGVVVVVGLTAVLFNARACLFI